MDIVVPNFNLLKVNDSKADDMTGGKLNIRHFEGKEVTNRFSGLYKRVMKVEDEIYRKHKDLD